MGCPKVAIAPAFRFGLNFQAELACNLVADIHAVIFF
jgi:hypothetical protein